MSELVARIRKLNNDISLLREQVLEERRKYVDEVDHSDQLAHFLSLSHNGKNCGPFCSFCDVIRTHENRRLDDYKNSFKIAAESEEAEASME